MSGARLSAAWASLGKAGRDAIAAAVIDAAYRVYERAGRADDFSVDRAAGVSLDGGRFLPDGSLRFGPPDLVLYWTPGAGFIVGGTAYPGDFLGALQDEAAGFDRGQDTLLGQRG